MLYLIKCNKVVYAYVDVLPKEMVVSVDGRMGRDIGTPLGKIELKTFLRWSLTLVKQYFSSFLSQVDNIDCSI
jgi:hypothetical protein